MGQIPERVVEVVHGPAFMQVGTRDAQLHPAHAWAIGARVHPDRTAVTFFLPASGAEPTLANLRDNGRVAMAVALASHEAYQLKGRFLAARPTTDEEVAYQEAYRVVWCRAMHEAGYPEEVARAFTLGFAYRPGVAVTFQVEEVFRQTPGPGAGTRME